MLTRKRANRSVDQCTSSDRNKRSKKKLALLEGKIYENNNENEICSSSNLKQPLNAPTSPYSEKQIDLRSLLKISSNQKQFTLGTLANTLDECFSPMVSSWLSSKKERKSSIEENQTISLAVECGWFPRGAMQVLLDHWTTANLGVSTGKVSSKRSLSHTILSISQFVHYYGPVNKLNLQNPDLKQLVKAQGNHLRVLRMVPATNFGVEKHQQTTPKAATNNELSSSSSSRSRKHHTGRPPQSPKLQGCGYRWIAKHATGLEDLEITLRYDVKQQLISRLQSENLHRLVLHETNNNVTVDALKQLIRRSPLLQELHILDYYGDSTDEDDSNSNRRNTTMADDAAKKLRTTLLLEGQKVHNKVEAFSVIVKT